MKRSLWVLVGTALALAGAATGATAPTARLASGLDRLRATGIAAANQTTDVACDNGQDRDEAGACPGEGGPTRGFTLFSGAATRPPPPTATQKPATPAPPATRSTPPVASAETFRCPAACDLRVTFKAGASELAADSEARLVQFAASLRDPAAAHRRYEIGGHTDASGSVEKNLSLSLARAHAVKAFLVAHGVAGSRLDVKGYGAAGLAWPNAPNDPRNRRIEARVVN